MGERGSIIVYSNFGRKRIEELREGYPELAERLQLTLRSLIDLEEIIKGNVYHPAFRGSFSIKKVLPALVPDLSYADLEIKNGDTAIARFARVAKGEIHGHEAEVTRLQLLKYCKMDTYAMLKLHEVLWGLAGGH